MERKKILIVEDETDLAKMIQVSLFDEGFDVIVANNGSYAERTLERESFDLVLTDINMPLLDGVQLIDNLKRKEKTKEIPVVVLSGYIDAKRLKELASLGITHVLTKPCSQEEIIAKVKKLLQEPSRHRP